MRKLHSYNSIAPIGLHWVEVEHAYCLQQQNTRTHMRAQNEIPINSGSWPVLSLNLCFSAVCYYLAICECVEIIPLDY